MHFYALVIAPGEDDPHEAVATAMAPHEERWDEETEEHSGHWDWWSIGGRWTGVLTDYDPEKDLANIRTCDLCGGTGDRATYRNESRTHQHPSGCNGCLGKGARVEWPTQWREYEGDIATARAVLDAGDEAIPHTLVVNGDFHAKETWNGETFVPHPDWEGFVKDTLRAAGDTRVIVVDYHS